MLGGIEKEDLEKELELENISTNQENEELDNQEESIPDLFGDTQEKSEELIVVEEKETINKEKSVKKLEEMKEVMQNGMSFLAGMYKMSTGKEISMD